MWHIPRAAPHHPEPTLCPDFLAGQRLCWGFPGWAELLVYSLPHKQGDNCGVFYTPGILFGEPLSVPGTCCCCLVPGSQQAARAGVPGWQWCPVKRLSTSSMAGERCEAESCPLAEIKETSLRGTGWGGQEWFAQNYPCSRGCPSTTGSLWGWGLGCHGPWGVLGASSSFWSWLILATLSPPPSQGGAGITRLLMAKHFQIVRKILSGAAFLWGGRRRVRLLRLQARRCAGRHAQRHPAAQGHPLGQTPPGDLQPLGAVPCLHSGGASKGSERAAWVPGWSGGIAAGGLHPGRVWVLPSTTPCCCRGAAGCPLALVGC